MNTLGPYVAARRQALRLTQQALADRAGLRRDAVAQIESGKSRVPLPGTRRDLARALGVRHVDLLVAAGELLPEEIASLDVPRPLPPDVARIVEILTDDDMSYKADVLEAILRMVDAWEGVSQAHRRAATG